MALPTTTELQTRFGRTFTTDQEARAQAAIEDAADLVAVEADLAGRDALPDDLPTPVAMVILKAALRVMQNPLSVTSSPATAGMVGANFSPYGASGPYLREEEKAIVRRALPNEGGSVLSLGLQTERRAGFDYLLDKQYGDGMTEQRL